MMDDDQRHTAPAGSPWLHLIAWVVIMTWLLIAFDILVAIIQGQRLPEDDFFALHRLRHALLLVGVVIYLFSASSELNWRIAVLSSFLALFTVMHGWFADLIRATGGLSPDFFREPMEAIYLLLVLPLYIIAARGWYKAIRHKRRTGNWWPPSSHLFDKQNVCSPDGTVPPASPSQ